MSALFTHFANVQPLASAHTPAALHTEPDAVILPLTVIFSNVHFVAQPTTAPTFPLFPCSSSSKKERVTSLLETPHALLLCAYYLNFLLRAASDFFLRLTLGFS